MSNINANSFRAKCGEEFSAFYRQITTAYCRTDNETSAAFENFNMRMLEGVTFQTSRELNMRNLQLSSAVVKLVGSDNASILEIQELSFRAFTDSILNSIDPTEEQYCEGFITSLENYLDVTFNYIGPCEAFEFTEGVTSLQSEYVSVVPAQELVSDAKFATKGKNWELVAGTKFSEVYSEAGMTVTIGDMCWHIASQCPKDLVSQRARWMAEVFTSLIRLGLRQSDYCHRARYGKSEPIPTVPWQTRNNELMYNSNSGGINFGGGTLARRYKVDKQFLDDFNSAGFQEKLNQIFSPPPKKTGNQILANRVSDGLGWLSRGRQSEDVSERLLFFFTAIEALLSENGGFAPVSDSIARYVSVIIANESATRLSIHSDMKSLYNLRSNLVHRGTRFAHVLNANNVQHFAETCFSVVINNLDLTMKHNEFLRELKEATHGGEWPINI